MGTSFSNFDEQSILKFIDNIFKDEKKGRLKRRSFMVIGDLINIELPDDYEVNF